MAFRKPKKIIQPNWHPNFRLVEQLPDIKVIRTDFFVNVVSVGLAVFLLGLVLLAEYNAFALNREIAKYNTDIGEKKGTNQGNLNYSAEFDRLAQDVAEVGKFLDVHLTPTEVLLALTDILPRNIVTKSLSYDDIQIQVGRRSNRSKGIEFRGSVQGSPDEATAIVTKFQEDLANHEVLKPLIKKVELISLVRSASGFSVSIRIELNPK
jgi:hypothetical protein